MHARLSLSHYRGCAHAWREGTCLEAGGRCYSCRLWGQMTSLQGTILHGRKRWWGAPYQSWQPEPVTHSYLGSFVSNFSWQASGALRAWVPLSEWKELSDTPAACNQAPHIPRSPRSPKVYCTSHCMALLLCLCHGARGSLYLV